MCEHCGTRVAVKARYHAGFSDLGFLYCDKDSKVVTFNAYDPEYHRAVGCNDCVPWQLTDEQQTRVEDALVPCPCGGNFLFKNPLRCPNCGKPLAKPIMKDIYFYVLDQIIDGEKVHIWKTSK